MKSHPFAGCRATALLLSLWFVHHSVQAASLRIAAGDFDREQTVVEVRLPEAIRMSGRLVGEGVSLPLQVEADGRGWFILPKLARGATLELQVQAPAPQTLQALPLEAHRSGPAVEFTQRGRAVFRFQAEPGEPPRPDINPLFRRGGYLHPVFSPSGRQVTDDFPPNHIHHHGIWSPWTKTEFEGREPDFWNMGQGKGRVEFVALEATWSGPVHAGFRSRQRMVDMVAKPEKVALNEAWEVRLFDVGGGPKPYSLFELTLTHTCATESPFKLPKYHYGGLGFRGNWAWNGADATSWLTSHGETDRVKGNATRADWCWIGGRVDGQTAGIAIMGHPGNFRSPQPMRLHPTEPFFCFVPSGVDDWAIEPGQPYQARYRFVVADGEADRALIDRLWRDYAHPPKVEVLP